MTKEEIKKAKSQYKNQKQNAKKRNVEFKLTFQEWIDWWIQTGHYDERGCKKHEYCMCRYNDSGAYEIGNIYCDTHANNIKTAHVGKTKTAWNKGKKLKPEQYRKDYRHSEETCKKMSEAKKKNPTNYWQNKTMTEEAKQKMAQRRTEWWAKKKTESVAI